jgi:hypothetical protein
MRAKVNRERVNDTAKLIIHRLIARQMSRDPSLVERVRHSLTRSADRFHGYTFIEDWDRLLNLPQMDLRRRLTKRDDEMTRLRLSSPFVTTDGINFEDVHLRRRIWRSAEKVAARSMDRVAA